MQSKKLKIKNLVMGLAVAGAAVLLGAMVVQRVKAVESSYYPPIVQKLVERFNLNTGEVQQVFDEVRGEHRAEMQVRFEERLSQATNDGKITQEQKEAILAKKVEMQANRGEFGSLSVEERQANREAHRQEMEAWAEENGIDLSLLPMLMGRGPGGGRGGPRFDR